MAWRLQSLFRMAQAISMSPYAQLLCGNAADSSISSDVVRDVGRALSDLNQRTGAVLGRIATSTGSVGMPAVALGAPAVPASSSVTGLNTLALAGVLFGIGAAFSSKGDTKGGEQKPTSETKPKEESKTESKEAPKPTETKATEAPKPPTDVKPKLTPPPGGGDVPEPPKVMTPPPTVDAGYYGLAGYLTPQAPIPDDLPLPTSK